MNDIDLARFDLNLLVVFDAVFESGHVGTAAERLHVSSSAVSHALGRLRELLADPLFLRMPKGVTPTARAVELAPLVTDILSRVRGVLGSVVPFDPRTSTRRFTIGAADATMAVVLPPLVALLRRDAPRIDLATKHLLPTRGVEDLESSAIDIAMLALDDVPARFAAKVLYEEEFVIAARRGHPFLRAPTLRRYCELQHALVSIEGDSTGYIDRVLAKKKLARRVAMTVPNFMLALAAVSETDLVAAVPKSLLVAHAARFALGSVEAPLPLRRWQVRAVASQAALRDPGVQWLYGAVETAMSERGVRRPRRPVRVR